MIEFNSNLQSVMRRISTAIQSIDVEKMTGEMATEVGGMMRKRIHEQGKASDGSGIGTYSPGYMKVRTGNFGNSGTYSRGKNKGNLKNAGVYARGQKRGNPRPKYNRSANTDVVLSLTREMENAFGSFKSDDGNWAIGFVLNPNRSAGGETFKHTDIAKKAEDELYKKPIYSLSKDEQTTIDSILDRFVVNAFRSTAP
jgi:hypothetical protein